jgi:hypothetical protein
MPLEDFLGFLLRDAVLRQERQLGLDAVRLVRDFTLFALRSVNRVSTAVLRQDDVRRTFIASVHAVGLNT